MTTETRAETVRQERRRKPGSLSASGLKLSVDESKLDRNTYAYRFVNDKDGRVQQLHGQDWDPVPDPSKPDTNSIGSLNSAHAGVEDSGKPFNAVLMRKRKDWHEEDQRGKQQRVDAGEEAIRRGKVADQKLELAGSGVYTPGGENTIEKTGR